MVKLISEQSETNRDIDHYQDPMQELVASRWVAIYRREGSGAVGGSILIS